MRSMNVSIYFPKMGYATGRKPHLKPMDHYFIPHGLYYLYTACYNLGHRTTVVDGNFSKDPARTLLRHKPNLILISSTTPQYGDALETIASLRTAGYTGCIYVGGCHVSGNKGTRDFLLVQNYAGKELGVRHVSTSAADILGGSVFHWVREVFDRNPLCAFSRGMNARQAISRIRGMLRKDLNGKLKLMMAKDAAHGLESDVESVRRSLARLMSEPEAAALEHMFKYIVPRIGWVNRTYGSAYELRGSVCLDHTLMTSLGCTKGCTFCSNSFMYPVAYKSRKSVRSMLKAFVRAGVFGIPVGDMYFLMNRNHAQLVSSLMEENAMPFAMQTCLEDLDEEILDELIDKDMKGFFVGIENPASYTLKKSVQLEKEQWLISFIRGRQKMGRDVSVSLSYIVGLPGVELEQDIKLLRHIKKNVLEKYRFNPEHLQVNLYAPYRPESGVRSYPFAGEFSEATHCRYILAQPEFFKFWGIAPIEFSSARDFKNRLLLNDIIYETIYPKWKRAYNAVRREFLDLIGRWYPELLSHVPKRGEMDAAIIC